ncbi:hypothetical protein [Sphingomonas sp. TWP1-3-1]|uniref:hypothetical protein n=1 Tax=Sphingomonas sp. TWP1-3-1 TaxID=2804612 RepID=UPI003CE8091F
MSENPDAVTATQEDREFAARWIVIAPQNQRTIRDGGWDHHHAVQAAARHRLASISKPSAEGFVLVPRDDDTRDLSDSILPAAMIDAGIEVLDKVQIDSLDYQAGTTTDWDDGMVAVAVYRAMLAASHEAEAFQQRVQPWLVACFGEMIAGDREERNHRFLEEALELVQACGCSASEAHQLVDYVYGRDVGDPQQEVGGVMVTLAALCLANGLDMHANGETELARVWTKVDAIRAKQAAKPKHSPLPQHIAATPTNVTLSEDVTALVIAAREFWDDNNDSTPESHALDKALEAFSSRVPYGNEPARAPRQAS